MDFTLTQYTLLLKSFIEAGYNFHTFESFIHHSFSEGGIHPSLSNAVPNPKPETFSNPKPETRNDNLGEPELAEGKPETKNLILRHDVDLLPQNSLTFARIQASLGIKSTYYFRIVPESFNEKIILEIASLGHEIGYHYETMDSAGRKEKGAFGLKPEPRTENRGKIELAESKQETKNEKRETKNAKRETQNNDLINLAYEEFCENLETFRKIVPITTICMHGSPRSPYDNRDIWKKYNYRDLGLTGEPYFDTDFSKIAYYTDTARMWDGNKFSVRDRIPTQTQDSSPLFPSVAIGLPTAMPFSIGRQRLADGDAFFLFPSFHSTSQIITSLQNNTFPQNAMFTFHPQRWTNQPIPWLKELILQNLKNLAKRWIVSRTN